MEKKGGARKRKGQPQEEENLADLIFSWSLQDVVNQDLFRDKVRPYFDRFLLHRSYHFSKSDPLSQQPSGVYLLDDQHGACFHFTGEPDT